MAEDNLPPSLLTLPPDLFLRVLILVEDSDLTPLSLSCLNLYFSLNPNASNFYAMPVSEQDTLGSSSEFWADWSYDEDHPTGEFADSFEDSDEDIEWLSARTDDAGEVRSPDPRQKHTPIKRPPPPLSPPPTRPLTPPPASAFKGRRTGSKRLLTHPKRVVEADVLSSPTINEETRARLMHSSSFNGRQIMPLLFWIYFKGEELDVKKAVPYNPQQILSELLESVCSMRQLELPKFHVTALNGVEVTELNIPLKGLESKAIMLMERSVKRKFEKKNRGSETVYKVSPPSSHEELKKKKLTGSARNKFIASPQHTTKLFTILFGDSDERITLPYNPETKIEELVVTISLMQNANPKSFTVHDITGALITEHQSTVGDLLGKVMMVNVIPDTPGFVVPTTPAPTAVEPAPIVRLSRSPSPSPTRSREKSKIGRTFSKDKGEKERKKKLYRSHSKDKERGREKLLRTQSKDRGSEKIRRSTSKDDRERERNKEKERSKEKEKGKEKERSKEKEKEKEKEKGKDKKETERETRDRKDSGISRFKMTPRKKSKSKPTL
eukprot:TRINITY_DN2527_c0_g1_i1.p1 TRINITY_DN2527_c0_g1~~TRINITY_DN2527_c0_g1_i1.p1  ORF type:complete len:597 (+),score=161.95 TRINITY_DN2527_c0_g1_i1:134-1792(+)